MIQLNYLFQGPVLFSMRENGKAAQWRVSKSWFSFFRSYIIVQKISPKNENNKIISNLVYMNLLILMTLHLFFVCFISKVFITLLQFLQCR